MKNPKFNYDNLILQEVGSELLVLHPDSSEVSHLNELSAKIARLCDGTRSVVDITQSLASELDLDECETLVELALLDLREKGLLSSSSDKSTEPAGISRRDALQKLSLVSAAMLPAVSSVLLPEPAAAASRLPNCASPCTANSQCNSGVCLNGRCSVGTTNSFVANTQLGASFSVPSPTCTALAAANCCSGNRIWFVTGNCFCGN